MKRNVKFDNMNYGGVNVFIEAVANAVVPVYAVAKASEENNVNKSNTGPNHNSRQESHQNYPNKASNSGTKQSN